MNKNNPVKFMDGQLVPTTDEVKYLGGILTKSVSAFKEISNRITATMPVLKSLDLFWKHANCSEKWKILVYNSVVISKLTYGLETLQFSDALATKLNSFQQKGLRKILGIPPTFIDRSNTNEKVFEEANKHWKSVRREGKPVMRT